LDPVTRRNRVAIGTDADGGYIFSTFGTGGTLNMSIARNGGNVAVGLATSTTAKLTVQANSGNNALMRIQTSDFVPTTTGTMLRIQSAAATGNTSIGLNVLTAGGVSNGDLILQEVSGSVIIGSSTPSAYKFAVESNLGVVNDAEYIISHFRRNPGGSGIVLGYVGNGTDAKAAIIRSANATDLRLGTTAYPNALIIDNATGNITAINYKKAGNNITKDIATLSGTEVDMNATDYNRTLTDNTTLTIKDSSFIYDSVTKLYVTGAFTLTFQKAGYSFIGDISTSAVGGAAQVINYDGTKTNLIQIVCTDVAAKRFLISCLPSSN
jgi:hypothetical protein